MEVAVEGVLCIHPLLDLLVLVSELLGLPDHLLNLLLRETALVVRDGDLLALARALVLSTHVQDAVGVDLKGHLNLGLSARGRRDPTKLELSKQVVVLGHGPFALVDLNVHGGLIVLVSGESLGLLGGNDRVARDQLRHHAAHSLNAQGQRRHIQQQQVLASFAAQDAGLHSSSVSHGLVRVDASVWLLAVEEVLDQLLHLGDACGTAHQHDLIHLVLLEAGILQHLLHRLKGVLEEVVVELLKARAGEGLREVDTIVERLNLKARLVGGAQGTLGLLDLAAQLLNGTLVLGHVLAMLLLEDLHEVLHHTLVKILSSQVGVTVGGHHLKDTVINGEEGNIEGSAAKVINQNVLLSLLVQTVGNGSRSGFVDDSQHIHAGNGSGILCGLTLRIVEVRRNGDHRMLHLLAQVVLGCLLHLGQHHGRNLLRSHDLLFALHLDGNHRLAALVHNLVWQELNVLLHCGILEASADQALHVKKSLRWVDSRLVLSGLTDQTLIIREGYVRGRDSIALIIGDNFHPPVFVDAHA
mmetsp:Transcript_48717/g.91272  ORF Transcript_48717/g.91272 Transcript_48717/m.91272 type:complete len:527 (-) Transcript_48717:171-1751(-)